MENKDIHPTAKRLYEAASKLCDINENRQTRVAKLLVTSPQVVKNWESRGVSKEGMILAQKKIGCRIEWIKDGELPISNQAADIGLNTPENDYSLISILDVQASCGNGRFNDQVFIEGGFALPKKMLREIGVSEANGRIIHATGDSMSPTIQKDAVVLINLADTELRDGRIYAICTPHEGLVLKRLIHEYKGSLKDYVWIMRSDNPDKDNHPDKQLPPDESTIVIGRAVWTDRKL